MRTFQNFPQDGVKCIICNTNINKQVVLIPIAGTGEGFNYEAIPVHLACIELFYNSELKILIQKLD